MVSTDKRLQAECRRMGKWMLRIGGGSSRLARLREASAPMLPSKWLGQSRVESVSASLPSLFFDQFSSQGTLCAKRGRRFCSRGRERGRLKLSNTDRCNLHHLRSSFMLRWAVVGKSKLLRPTRHVKLEGRLQTLAGVRCKTFASRV